MSILVDKWEKDDTNKNNLKARNKKKNKLSDDSKPSPTGILKIRILPTKRQVQVIKNWLGAYNLTWNKALHYIQTTKAHPSFIPLKNKFTVINSISSLGQPNPDVPEFLTLTPSKIRQYAIRDICTAFESAKTNKRRGNISSFTIKAKKKKNQKRCFSLPISKDGLSLFTKDDDKTMNSDSMGKRKTHISIFPKAMKDCFNKVQSKPPRCPDFLLKEHLAYKNQIGSNEIWEDYCKFIIECGQLLTMKQKTLRLYYQSLVGMDIWEDYYKFMMDQEFYDYIDYDYKQLYKKTPVVKSNTQSNYSTYIRFFHRKNDKLLYNLSIDYDCVIKYEYGIWYLHIPYVRPPRKEPQLRQQTTENKDLNQEIDESIKHIDTLYQTIVGLDPGFKTFLAFFSHMIHGKIQQNHIFKKIRSKLDYYNKLYYGKKIGNIWINQPKQISYTKFIHKTNMLYRKQSHLAMQMHYNAISFLTGNFNWILLPSFESQEMVKGNKLSKETKREASQLQHYKFKQRLQSACSSMKNCKVLIVSEAWTSKTCGRCGFIKNNLTLKDRIYSCGKCGLNIDRDVNGSRNILLRNIQG